MKKIINSAVATLIACSALLTLPSCANAPQVAQDVWNNPAVQAEIARLEQQAISYVAQWIVFHVGNRGASNIPPSAVKIGIGTVTGKMAAENPTVDRRLIEKLVTAAFAEKVQ